MYGVLHVALRGITEISSRSFQIIYLWVHRVHFHMDGLNGVKYVDNGDMCHPTIPHCRNIKRRITLHSVSFVKLLDTCDAFQV
jgi:hypothetical protein